MGIETDPATAPVISKPAEAPATDPAPFTPGPLIAPTRAEREAAREQKRKDLEAQLMDLKNDAPTLQDLSDDELHIAFHDELVQLLGAHPRLDAIWQELRSRIAPPPADAATKAE